MSELVRRLLTNGIEVVRRSVEMAGKQNENAVQTVAIEALQTTSVRQPTQFALSEF